MCVYMTPVRERWDLLGPPGQQKVYTSLRFVIFSLQVLGLTCLLRCLCSCQRCVCRLTLSNHSQLSLVEDQGHLDWNLTPFNLVHVKKF